MRSSQNSFLLFFCAMAIVSLACFSAAETWTAYPTSTEAPVVDDAAMVPADAAVAADPIPTIIVIVEHNCAVVAADEALHLRVDPDPESGTLAFMVNGEVVQVISTTNTDWWLIKRGNQLGYARSKYLSRVECR